MTDSSEVLNNLLIPIITIIGSVCLSFGTFIATIRSLRERIQNAENDIKCHATVITENKTAMKYLEEKLAGIDRKLDRLLDEKRKET